MKKLFQRIKKGFSKLGNDMKDMTFLQKVDHLWTYYKEYAAVVIMSLVIVLAVLISALTPPETIVHSGTMVNVSLSLEGHDYLTDVFYEKVLGSPEGKVALTDTMYTGTDTVDSVEESYQAYMGISAKVEAKELDYMLMDPNAMNYYGSDDILMDLRELLDPEELEQLHKDGEISAHMFRNILKGYANVVDISKFTVIEEKEEIA